ncbi:MAG: nitrite reductase small subunit NirD [Vicinamibacterales bacterium]
MNQRQWIRIGPCEHIPPQAGRAVALADRDVAVFNLGDRFLAVDDACPHQGGPLSDGIVSGNTVVCRLHSWKINLESGCVERPGSQKACVHTYETRIEDGEVLLCLTPSNTATSSV